MDNTFTNTRRRFIRGLGVTALVPLLPQLSIAGDAADENGKPHHRIMTCNIRVALPEDDAKSIGWNDRKDICLKVIGNHKPDIICLQEVLKVQADDLRRHFRKFQLFGFDGPEMDANPVGYHGIAKNPIMFRTDRYELLGGGTYWLSESPLVAGSKSWDTARARHANWVRLVEKKTGKEFRVINLHLDHISNEARVQQVKMVVTESGQYPADFAQILTGDFNARSTSNVFDTVRANAWTDSYAKLYGDADPGFTVHEFEGLNYTKGKEKGKIDFVWYHGGVNPLASAVVRDAIDGRYPSDHFFVTADVELI